MILKSIILGTVQGLTEFLPVSSAGHLAIMERYFGIAEPAALAAYLHLGTLIATVLFFLQPIKNICTGCIHGKKESLNYVRNIIIGTIPIVFFALMWQRQIEDSFHDMTLIAFFLGLTGLVLILTSITKKGDKPVTALSALLIGIGQMFAAFPGISRSGITISSGLFLKVEPRAAFTFSFLFSLPAILGGNLLELLTTTERYDTLSVVIGILFSCGAGLIALRILRSVVLRRFHLFGIYCLAVSVVLLLLQ